MITAASTAYLYAKLRPTEGKEFNELRKLYWPVQYLNSSSQNQIYSELDDVDDGSKYLPPPDRTSSINNTL